MTGPRKIAPRYPNVADVMSPSLTRARSSVTLCASWHGDEIDQLLDPAEEFRLEVGVAGHRAQDALPGRGHLRRPSDGAEHAFLPRLPGRNIRPGRDADRGRPHGGPDVDERMPRDQHVGRAHAGRDPGFLGA